MRRHRYRMVGSVNLARGMQGRSGNWCRCLGDWCASRIMRKRYLPALTRGSRHDGIRAPRRLPTPACVLDYVTSQHGAGWAIVRQSAMPY